MPKEGDPGYEVWLQIPHKEDEPGHVEWLHAQRNEARRGQVKIEKGKANFSQGSILATVVPL